MKSKTTLILENNILRQHLAALVDSCTPQFSKLPGEDRYHGATAPDKVVLEAARNALEPT